MDLMAKELRRSHSAATKSNWVRYIKPIIQRKTSIHSMKYTMGGGIFQIVRQKTGS